ncbi:unnamed protein product [Paramecium octaurelia]|uniref:Uncharacterized protein n=1 Tax=Paramecium octaurelia TaxID=43137 RepID=A0A8S1WME3_PAROT|nr:unnamed protein product [Paramecium octaurelia]
MLHYHSEILVTKVDAQDYTPSNQHFLNMLLLSPKNQYYTVTNPELISKASIFIIINLRSQRPAQLPEYPLGISFSSYLRKAQNQGKHNNKYINYRDQDSRAQIPNRPLIVILFFCIEFKPILVSRGLEIPITNLCCCKVVKKWSWSCKMGYSFKSVSTNSHSFSFDDVERSTQDSFFWVFSSVSIQAIDIFIEIIIVLSQFQQQSLNHIIFSEANQITIIFNQFYFSTKPRALTVPYQQLKSSVNV